MELSISIEGMVGLTWPRWKRLVAKIEQLGFAGLFRSDHFTLTAPPDLDSLELIVSLSYLASYSERVHFGSLVAPVSIRDPVMLARQAMALDDLSGGRMILGVGAGWLQREHTMFGYDLADVPTRMARLEEGLEVITRLVRSENPENFEGRFFHLREAHLLPRPQRPGGPLIMVGGNGIKRTLPLVARYADIWNCQLMTPEAFKERSAVLDELMRATGRQLSEIKRTVMVPVICWRKSEELEQYLSGLRQSIPTLAAMSTDRLEKFVKTNLSAITGSPEVVIEQLRAYKSVGAEELIIQWFSLDDIGGLERCAEYLLSEFAA